MDITSFFLSPLGWVFIATLLGVAAVSLRITTLAIRQRSAVYYALLAAAKQRAHQKISLIMPLRRRADSLTPLFEQLASHSYEQLELVVVVYHTAGKAAARDAKMLGRSFGLQVKTVKHTKGMTVEDAALKHATGKLVTLAEPTMRFSPRFFEKVSYAFMQPIEATRVRRLVRVDRTLMSVFWAATAALHQVLTASFRRPVSIMGLSENVIVRRTVLAARTSYQAKSELYDEYAITTNLRIGRPTWRALLALTILITGTILLVATTPPDLLLYVSALVIGVLFVTVEITLMQQTGPTQKEKTAMFFIVPFLPLFAGVVLTVRSVQVALAATRHLVQRQLARKKRLAQRARTQAERLSI